MRSNTLGNVLGAGGAVTGPWSLAPLFPSPGKIWHPAQQLQILRPEAPGSWLCLHWIPDSEPHSLLRHSDSSSAVVYFFLFSNSTSCFNSISLNCKHLYTLAWWLGSAFKGSIRGLDTQEVLKNILTDKPKKKIRSESDLMFSWLHVAIMGRLCIENPSQFQQNNVPANPLPT